MGEVRQTPCTTAHGRKKGRKRHKVLRTNTHSSGAETFALLRGQLAPLPSCGVRLPLISQGNQLSLGNWTAVKDGPCYITSSYISDLPITIPFKLTLEKRRGELLYSPIFHRFQETRAQGTDSRVTCSTQSEDTLLLLPLFRCINALSRDLGP